MTLINILNDLTSLLSGPCMQECIVLLVWLVTAIQSSHNPLSYHSKRKWQYNDRLFLYSHSFAKLAIKLLLPFTLRWVSDIVHGQTLLASYHQDSAGLGTRADTCQPSLMVTKIIQTTLMVNNYSLSYHYYCIRSILQYWLKLQFICCYCFCVSRIWYALVDNTTQQRGWWGVWPGLLSTRKFLLFKHLIEVPYRLNIPHSTRTSNRNAGKMPISSIVLKHWALKHSVYENKDNALDHWTSSLECS